jgi:DNA repair protein RadC
MKQNQNRVRRKTTAAALPTQARVRRGIVPLRSMHPLKRGWSRFFITDDAELGRTKKGEHWLKVLNADQETHDWKYLTPTEARNWILRVSMADHLCEEDFWLNDSAAAPAPPTIHRRTNLAMQPAEFKIVRLRECPMDTPVMDSPDAVADVWRNHVECAPWFNPDVESFYAFLLNVRNRLIGFQMISQGTLDKILVHPREVFRAAIMHNASSIVIAHNHPSGDPCPSDADVKVTRDLQQSAQQLKIGLHDHLVMGRPCGDWQRGFCSLKELGLLH